MVDHGEADDKIVAVLDNDPVWETSHDLADLPLNMVDRLDHYFRTYKLLGDPDPAVIIEARYGRDEALAVVKAAMDDYAETFGH